MGPSLRHYDIPPFDFVSFLLFIFSLLFFSWWVRLVNNPRCDSA